LVETDEVLNAPHVVDPDRLMHCWAMVTGTMESKAVRRRPVAVVDLLIFVDREDAGVGRVDSSIFPEKSSSSQRSIIVPLSCCIMA
jgi:hypothetical protein